MAWLEARSDSGVLRGARRALGVLGVAAGYYIGGMVGTVLSLPPSGFAILWPATAFLIGVLLITPPRTGWLYLAGVLPAHAYLAARTGGIPWPVMASQVSGNIGLALATVAVLRSGGEAEPRFNSLRGSLRFILLAGALVPAVGNAMILSLHLLTGWTDAFWLSWRQWMLASIFQAATQVQEQSLSFVPKVAALMGVLLVSGSWMLTKMVDLTHVLISALPTLAK